MSRPDLSSQAFKRSPHQTLAELVAADSFCEARIPILGRVLATTRHAATLDLLKNTEDFVVDARNAGHRNAFGMPFVPTTLSVLSQNLLTLDDPDHRRLRQLSDAPFRKLSIDAMRPVIAARVETLLDTYAASGQGDIVAPFCRELPLQVIFEILGLSVPLRQRFDVAIKGLGATSTTLGSIRALFGLGPLMKYLRVEIEQTRAAPHAGLMSDLVHAEQQGQRLSEDELVAMIFALFIAGHETTAHLLSTSIFTLLTEPDALEQFHALDERGRSIAVDELMRHTGPVQFTKPRYVRADMDFHGRTLKKGSAIMALLAAGNLDPEVFEHPMQLDLSRRPNRHLGWGGGPHLCLGLHLAKAETEIALEALFRRWPEAYLACAPDEIKWVRRTGVRGPAALSIRSNA